ncbi:hypothetical protein ACFPES_28895 [Paenibacillus sp. GCM10023248]|uniref:hypothetical protein n=1 Tax=Bacillales TaxID=1385 RepID=UPI00237924D0|nr:MULTISPECIES: hypothetical protein [Bacillales]MDD9271071.1 hypothetical protein [Paenibacillus sp. MAHUQ-63]MDR6885042.1 magnesium-transporting ATPase (P-type) [Bacillus sp. 3255]
MNRVRNVIKLHMKNKMSWIWVPWMILGLNFVISFVIALSLNEDETMNTGGLFSVFIYMLVTGSVTLKDTFPFALGLSIRRKDYFLGTVAMASLVSLFTSVLLTVVSLLEDVTGGWGVRLHIFKVAFLSDFSPIVACGIYFIILLHMYFMGFAISSVHRRYGGAGLLIFFIAAALLTTTGALLFSHFALWGLMFAWMAHHYLELFWWMVPVVAFYLAVSYGLLRRAAV